MSKRIKRFLISFVAAYMMFSMLATGRVDFVQDVYAASGDSVETIHNPALTYIHLFNYKGGSSRQANNTEGINNGHDLKFGRSGPNDGSPNSYKDGSGAITGIVRRNLEDGYPVNDFGNNESLSYLFDDSAVENGVKEPYMNTNYLFTVDENGYYYFASDEYKAILDKDTLKYTVTEQPGGYFFPFYNGDNISTTFNEDKHFFGVHMQTNFSVPNNGKVLNQSGVYEPMVYEFTGDDDVWVFIDGMLVGDVGGVHNALTLSIDFATGDVIVKRRDNPTAATTQKTTIYLQIVKAYMEKTGCSEAEAKAYLNSAESGFIWNEKVLDENGDYKTYADRTYHDMDFFYLERGANRSNMRIKYNLVSIYDFSAHKSLYRGSTENTILQKDQFKFKLTGYPLELEDGTVMAPVMPVTYPEDIYHSRNYSDDGNGFIIYEPGLEEYVAVVGNSKDGNINFGNTKLRLEQITLSKYVGKAFRYKVEELPPDGAVQNADGTYTYNGTTVAQNQDGSYTFDGIDYHFKTYYFTGYVTDEGWVSKWYYSDDTYTTRLADITFIQFDNYYDSAGRVSLAARKSFINENGSVRTLNENQFSFRIRDITDPDTSKQSVIEVAGNKENGSIIFDPISYTFKANLQDGELSSRTFVYELSEIIPDNRSPYIAYSADRYYAAVTISDSGDGNLQISAPVYYKNLTEEQISQLRANTLTGITEIPAADVVFENVFSETSVTITKIWQDGDNAEGFRPSSVNFRLYKTIGQQSGAVEGYESVELTGSGDTWTKTIEHLPKYLNGTEIVYSVKELDGRTEVENGGKAFNERYTASYSEDKLTVTNSREVEKTRVTVEKDWDDADDQDGKRASVNATIQLYKTVGNGDPVPVGDPVNVTADDDWKNIWNDLPVYENGKQITYSAVETLPQGSEYDKSGEDAVLPAVKGDSGVITITNSYKPEEIALTVNKKWEDKSDQDGKRDGVTAEVTLYRKVGEGEPVAVETVTVPHSDGTVKSWTKLPVYEAGTKITYSVDETFTKANGYALESISDPQLTEDATAYVITVTNRYNPETTSVKVIKDWDDADNQDGKRPEKLTVSLLADGKDTGRTVELTEKNQWTGTIDGLDKYRYQGTKIVYSWSEYDFSEDYELTKAETDETGCITSLTNSHTPETTTITVTKKWNDANDNDGKRAGVDAAVTLYKTVGEETTELDTVKVGAEENWFKTWDPLPVYDSGTKIVYSVRETLTVANGYSTDTPDRVTVEHGGSREIINSYTPETTKLTVTKIWSDSNDQDRVRKDVKATLQLYKTVSETKTAVGDPVEVSTSDGWSNTWNDLPVFENKVRIVYSVEETLSEGTEYAKSGDDVTKTAAKDDSGTIVIINTYIPKTVEISVEKVWKDNDDQDGYRPESVTLILKADGKTIRQIVLTARDKWKATIDKLPMYKDGVEIRYEIDEIQVAEYETGLTDSAEAVQAGKKYQFTVTNTHQPEQTSITVTKIWDDKDDRDGIRNSVKATVQLYKTVGETTAAVGDPVEVSAADDWSNTWDKLPVYEGGKKITYSVKETLPENSGYTKSGDDVTRTAVKGDSGTIQIRNTHTPEQLKLTVKKIWDDDNNNDGVRPQKLTVRLLADSKDTGKTVELNEKNQWTASVDELDRYRDQGTEIVYSWEETDLPEGYKLTGTDRNETVITLTNTHENELIEIPVEKIWKGDEKFDVRPDLIVLELYAGEEKIAELELTEENKWKNTFTNIEKYRNGKLAEYTLREADVPAGYASAVTGNTAKGFTVTNTFEPISFDPPVMKEVTGDITDNTDEFTFRFEAVTAGAPMPEKAEGKSEMTVSLKAGEKHEFGNVYLTKPGTYVYKITEVAGDNEHYTYDDTEYVLEFVISEGKDGELTCSLTVNGKAADYTRLDPSQFKFVNVYRDYVDVEVVKIWGDNNNVDGLRPQEIEVTLYAGNKKVETVKLSEKNSWSYSWTGLDYSDEKYEKIQYTVKENKVPKGYTMSQQQEGNKVTITNATAPPDTGDSDNLKLWMTVLALSMTGSAAVASVSLKKRKEEEE